MASLAAMFALALTAQPAPDAPAEARAAPSDEAPAPEPAAATPVMPPFDPPAPAAGDAAPPADPGAYDAGVKGAFAAEEARLGPLDGAWILASADGRAIFRLQISDAGPAGPLEGAWSDRLRPQSIHGDGFVERIERRGDRLVIRFHERPAWFAKTAILTLEPDGAWRGRLRTGWRTRAAAMRRP